MTHVDTAFPTCSGIRLRNVGCGHELPKWKQQCNNTEVWNADLEECISCSICQKYPKTLSCDACVKEAEHSTNIWMVVALVSFSLVTILLAMGIGVLVHHCKSRSDKPLREPIEETTGPLYAIV
ncbi:uncharacterized protein si:rp71-1c10.7 isoform X1 [Lepisosteus oculatus]|uniref:uncharacterized protein si:rp71-1c10.7 isoform X1 n=1 Tax=Lepisosteus oculatus TaxID=7918 RepID=UPI00371A2752